VTRRQEADYLLNNHSTNASGGGTFVGDLLWFTVIAFVFGIVIGFVG
jgi:hypothetical protein